MAISDLLGLDKKKKLIIRYTFLTIGILFEIYLFTLLSLFPTQVGTLEGLDMDYNLILTIYQIFLLLVFLITFILFARESISSKNPELKLKGQFLLVSAFSFTIGAILEIMSSLSIVILILAKVLLILSAFEFYNGFFLPKWINELFLKKK
jgi:hypothetical protein